VLHATQVALDVAASAVEYEFCRQSVHATAPVSALCLPAWHAVQGRPSLPVTCEWYPARHLQSASTLLIPGANVLIGQISHCAAPAAEYVLASHCSHSSSDTAPGFDDLYPAPQLEHVVASSCALNDPALHTWHVAFAKPRLFVMYPGRHLQSDCRVLPMSDFDDVWHPRHTLLEVAATACENVLLPHSVHLSGPSVVLYVPGTHAMHAWPFSPVYPALHWQSVASSLPAGAFEFNGQLEHVGTT
jgi:hypothetical protein